METIYLAGGCFWCTEAVFRALHGVSSVIPGYIGGHTENPTYEEVCTGATGHTEAIKVEYDPNLISTEKILDVFFDSHDPTTFNRQGADVGSQYRSAIFFTGQKQQEAAENKIAEYGKKLPSGKEVVTELSAAETFYPAEEYHHDYFKKNPDKMYCQVVIAPKIKKLEEEHKDLLNE